MKSYAQMKAKGPSRFNAQQATFELKQKVVVALNKLADRDTCQIGADELEKTAQSLTADAIAPFLSCILDTDKEQKSAVRKECIRLLGVLVNYHQSLVGPYVTKMVATIVKRLRDPDSIVRDACVDTMGVLASKLSDDGDENGGAFVSLVRPLFEALGEQNKQMQSGSAWCLAKVIDNTHDPPVSILQRMLTRTIKLLKNPHFMAKPAVIELNRSIIQAGGAPSHNVLSAAMTSIQEALKNSDWATRKAASTALAEIASCGGSWLESFKSPCITSLESCRFDKVKPVRETVLHALQYWKGLPGSDTHEPSETGSSIKENFGRADYSDITSDSMRRDVTPGKAVADLAKRRVPLSVKRTCQNFQDSQHFKTDDWKIDIAVPKSHGVSLADIRNEESECSSVTKTLERFSSDVTSAPDVGCEYAPVDDEQDCSSVSNLDADNFETKFVTISQDSLEEGCLLKSTGRNQQSAESTVIQNSFQRPHGCCSQVANEMACIQKKLLEIENKQSNLMELLQVFSTGIMDSLSMLRSNVSSLEHEVDRISNAVLNGPRHSDSAISKLMKQNPSVSSPRLSTYTPRPSVEICNRQPSSFSAKKPDIWADNTFGRSRSINSAKQGTERLTNPAAKTNRIAIATKDMQKSSGDRASNMQFRSKVDASVASVLSNNARDNGPENYDCLWQRVKHFLCEGNLDSAYVEALSSADELVLIELLDRTGPVLENLSCKTVSDLLGTLASYLLERRFTNSIIPWLHQAMDLSAVHGPDCLVLSAKARREFLSAIQEAHNMEFSNPAERRSITQIAMRLSHLWGNSCR
ncbi:TORTIFOLIA1-like protein 2 [Euphorbia lathyris]|uniref:TORTIFOLIA1-like protein 2 n=1 Tax=Euphorbia lathyris TaxID=212925 RepID=UPI00331434A0